MKMLAARVEDVSDDVQRVLRKFDDNHDSIIQDNELAKALSCPSLKVQDATTVAMIAAYRAESDELGLPNLSVAEFDKMIDEAAKMDDLSHKHADMLSDVGKKFAMLDANNDHRLSRDEMNRLSGSMCDDLRERILENGPISKSELKVEAEKVVHAQTAINNLFASQVAVERNWLLSSSEGLPAFVHKANPEKDVTAYVGKQGRIGDCYFEGAISALAQANPKAISKMIEDNKNGTYSVSFPGQSKIVLGKPTLAEELAFNNPSSEGSWVSVLEKAYGVLQQRKDRDFLLAPQMKLNNGGFSETVMQDFTGKPADVYHTDKLSVAQLGKIISSAMVSNRPICVGTTKKGYDSIIDEHCYSVVGFNPKGRDGGTITVRNPWKENLRTFGNLISISVKDFKNQGSKMQIGRF